MHSRLPDWQFRFASFVEGRQSMPFAWGSNDCCTFAGDCVAALTGIDPAPEWRGHGTAKQAHRTLQGIGGIEGLATAALGAPSRAALAQVGDVILVKCGKRDALAVCNGSTALMPSKNGLVTVGFDAQSMCWRII